MKVLFVEDELAVRMGGEQALMLAGLEVQGFESAEQVRPQLSVDFPGVLVTDVRLPGEDGLSLLRHCVGIDPALPVVLVTGHGDVAMAVEAMRLGAYDFIEKPYASEQLAEVVRRALEHRRLVLENRALRRQLADRSGVEALILGQSPAIGEVRRLIGGLADTDADVLVCGETGTGKELVARALHEASRRRGKPYVALNCGALPESVFESEIFGHEAGAFTGASKRRIGKIEHASGGTLFLDEIETMPLNLQVKLLRVLQERQVERLGMNVPVPVDLRVVAATKEDLRQLAEEGRFRADLYYRLNIAAIDLPPLRERREDIPLLFEHFLLQAAARYEREPPQVDAALRRALSAYDWPGNVRELRNIADRYVLGILGAPFLAVGASAKAPLSLQDELAEVERTRIEHELRRAAGDTAAAAAALGIPRTTLYDKLKRHGLSAERFR